MAKSQTMDELLQEAGDEAKQAAVGDIVTGKVLSVKKYEVLVDLGARGVGLVPRREASYAKNMEVGDEIQASVIDTELENGYVLLSLTYEPSTHIYQISDP